MIQQGRARRWLTLCIVIGSMQLSWRSARAEPQQPRFRIELGAMLGYDERQIEDDARDDKVTQDFKLSFSLTSLVRVWRGLSVGLMVDFDRAFDRLQASGAGVSAWELDLALLTRYTFARYFFAHLGYMFLMLRNDSSRADLRNVDGASDGVFVGSHTVAYVLGLGAQYPIHPSVAVLFKLDYRIRYFVSRGGADLAEGANYGGQSLYPYLGAAYSF